MIKFVFLLLLLLSPTFDSFAWSWGGKPPIQQALGSDPPDKQASFPKATSSNTESNTNPDLGPYNKGVELFQIAQIQAEKGNLAGQKTLLKEAMHQFELALKVNPKRVEAKSNIGFVHLTLRNYSAAIKAFKAALEIAPKHLNTLNGLATAYTLTTRYTEAMSISDQLIQLAPSEGQYWFNRGSLFQKAGRPIKAKEAYQKALLINSSDQRSLFNLGVLAEGDAQLQEARALYTKAKDSGIDTPIGLEALHRLEALPSPNAVGPTPSKRK